MFGQFEHTFQLVMHALKNVRKNIRIIRLNDLFQEYLSASVLRV